LQFLNTTTKQEFPIINNKEDDKIIKICMMNKMEEWRKDSRKKQNEETIKKIRKIDDYFERRGGNI
jgi:hypothetical protein